MRRHGFGAVDWWMWSVCVFSTIAFAVAVAFAVRECKAKEKCTGNGGRIVEFNCSTICSLDANSIMTCSDHCDWRCVGASAEDAR